MRYFIGFLVTIGLIIVLILLLVGGGNKAPKKVTPTEKTLVSYADSDASLRMTIDGPIVADQDHEQLQITVSRNSTNFSVIKGYRGDVGYSKDFAGNQEGFTTFLKSLSLAGFNNGEKSADFKDERGHCALGERYIFELLDESGNSIQRYWTSTCGNVKSYLGNFALTAQLFENQVPGFDDLRDGLTDL